MFSSSRVLIFHVHDWRKSFHHSSCWIRTWNHRCYEILESCFLKKYKKYIYKYICIYEHILYNDYSISITYYSTHILTVSWAAKQSPPQLDSSSSFHCPKRLIVKQPNRKNSQKYQKIHKNCYPFSGLSRPCFTFLTRFKKQTPGPSNRIRPLFGWYKPVSNLIKVVFPDDQTPVVEGFMKNLTCTQGFTNKKSLK